MQGGHSGHRWARFGAVLLWDTKLVLCLRVKYYTPVAERGALPEKQDVARALLLRGSVFVHLDPRVKGVSVPDFLCGEPQVVLQIGLDMPVPIPDLRVDGAGLSGTLSFKRSPHLCKVCWPAVFALVGEDGKGVVWPEDLPVEIAAEVGASDQANSPSPTPGPAPAELRMIEGGGASTDGDAVDEGEASEELESEETETRLSSPPPAPKTKLPPYLRVVK